MSERSNKLYIDDALESIVAIKEFTHGIDYEEFYQNRMIYSATIREFIVIGEAISKVIDSLSEVRPDYPWRAIKDFRNFIVHEYFGVDPQIVWDAASQELDELQEIIEKFKEKNEK